MRATLTTTTEGHEEAAKGEDLAGRDGTLIGEIVDEGGSVIRCRMARSRERAERLVYVVGLDGPATCLGWVADATAQKEAQAVWEDYLAADPSERWARPVTVAEAESLARSGQSRRRGSGGEGAGKSNDCPRLDGPGVYEWMVASKVIEEGRITSQVGDSRARRLSAWRSGDAASAHVLDEMLCGKGIHLSEVPEELWLSAERASRSNPQTPETRSEGASRYLAGEGAQALAAEYGVSAHSIRNWARGRGTRTAAAA